jgi:hypothetical protein
MKFSVQASLLESLDKGLRYGALLFFVAGLPACKMLDKRPDHYGVSSHASRQQTLDLLEREGILNASTKVQSAIWNEDTKEYVVTLQNPTSHLLGGDRSVWYVDREAKHYHGESGSR